MKKSKVDAIIKRKVAEAEARARYAGIVEGERLERERQTFLLAPQEGAAMLTPEPQYPFVHIRIGMFSGRSEPVDPRAPFMRRERVAKFRAVQKAWSTSEGHKVAWYEWQFEGIS